MKTAISAFALVTLTVVLSNCAKEGPEDRATVSNASANSDSNNGGAAGFAATEPSNGSLEQLSNLHIVPTSTPGELVASWTPYQVAEFWTIAYASGKNAPDCAASSIKIPNVLTSTPQHINADISYVVSADFISVTRKNLNPSTTYTVAACAYGDNLFSPKAIATYDPSVIAATLGAVSVTDPVNGRAVSTSVITVPLKFIKPASSVASLSGSLLASGKGISLLPLFSSPVVDCDISVEGLSVAGATIKLSNCSVKNANGRDFSGFYVSVDAGALLDARNVPSSISNVSTLIQFTPPSDALVKDRAGHTVTFPAFYLGIEDRAKAPDPLPYSDFAGCFRGQFGKRVSDGHVISLTDQTLEFDLVKNSGCGGYTFTLKTTAPNGRTAEAPFALTGMSTRKMKIRVPIAKGSAIEGSMHIDFGGGGCDVGATRVLYAPLTAIEPKTKCDLSSPTPSISN